MKYGVPKLDFIKTHECAKREFLKIIKSMHDKNIPMQIVGYNLKDCVTWDEFYAFIIRYNKLFPKWIKRIQENHF